MICDRCGFDMRNSEAVLDTEITSAFPIEAVAVSDQVRVVALLAEIRDLLRSMLPGPRP